MLRAIKSKAGRKLAAAEKKKVNIAFQQSVEAKREKIDPVLGRPHNQFFQRLQLEIEEPDRLAKSFQIHEVDKLLYGAKSTAIDKLKREAHLINSPQDKLQNDLSKLESLEDLKRDTLLRILSLRNADNVDKQKIMTQLAINEFQRFDGDTGSSEVQAAVMSIEIINLMNHIKTHPQDLLHIRKVRMLTQKRQRILRYLKRDDPQRYFWAIAKLGLTDEVIHMEFNFDRQYSDDFQVWPGRTLVRLTKKDNEQLNRDKRSKRHAIKRDQQQ